MTEFEQYSSSSTANVFLHAASALGIPFERVDGASSYWRLGGAEDGIVLHGADLGINPSASIRMTEDKAAAQGWLQKNGLPVPRFRYRSLREDPRQAVADVVEFASRHFPVVVKPNSRRRAIGVYTDIGSEPELLRVMAHFLKEGHRDVMVEQHVQGETHRVLVLDDTVVDVVHWTRSRVVGDGVSTVRDCIDRLNAEDNKLPPVPVNIRLVERLRKRGLALNTALETWRELEVAEFAGRKGTRRIRVPVDTLPAATRECFLKARRVSGMRLLGIDLICDDVTLPPDGQNFHINEINSSPGMGLRYIDTDENDLPVAMEILRRLMGVEA